MNNNRNRRNKERIYSALEVVINKPRKVKSYNLNKGVTVEQGYFNLVNQISTDQALQPSNASYKTVGLLGLPKTFKREG